MSRRRIALVALFIALATVAGQTACGRITAEDTFQYAASADGVDSLRVSTTNGYVTVVGVPSSDVISVDAHVVAPAAERNGAQHMLETVPIVHELVSGERKFIVRCETNDDMNGDIEVNFTLRVPPRIAVIAKIVNGAVTVSNVRAASGRAANGPVALSRVGSADVGTVNGDIRVETCTGPVEARTLHGSVNCSLIGDGGSVEVKTLIGSVDIEIPSEWPASYDLKSLVGSISVDGIGRRVARLVYESPGDGPHVRVRTLVGSVDIRRR